ncbi:hypothetical protein [Natronincola ferrireducens]|uniref:Uncharacterized protein n=1 Tax=Natronincola ferrireducens TaxID=393762 RepID=A0A1G9IEK1_9FIRM|nr:hypothetical protein [Natronincola ferrireducens]SDL23465.1 hypothetical protein SAMN05660472_02843 [Natronincola ferrireducens]
MVKMILICGTCGNEVEMVPHQVGHQIQMSKLVNYGFRVDTPSIDKYGDIGDYEDIDDVDVELREIRINCSKCQDDYIVLEF